MAAVFDLLYGPSGNGKSQAIVELIKELHKQTGKKARAYVGDGGTETYLNSGLVDLGILTIVEYDGLDWPFTVMDRMVKGWMPATEGSKKGVWGPVNNEDYILTVFEGAAVLAKYLLGSTRGGLAYRAGQGELIGNKKEEEVVKTKDESLPWMGGDGVSVGSNTMGHYRHMQPHLVNAIKLSKKLPGWVLWTSHPTETADKDEGGKAGDFGKLQGKTLVAPDVGGKAPGSWISREFGNTLHFDVATKLQDQVDEHTAKRTKTGDREYRIYTRSHFDPDGNWLTEYRAVNRCSIPDLMPDFLTEGEHEGAGTALVKFYGIMAQAKATQMKQIQEAASKTAQPA